LHISKKSCNFAAKYGVDATTLSLFDSRIKDYRDVYRSVDSDTPVEYIRGVISMDDGQWTKVIRDGQLYLLHKGTLYNVQGAEVK
jgi:hypothetical protein